MSTPLFDGTETPNNFFAPVLEPVKVAQEIVSAIDNGNGGVIRLPTYASFISWYAVLPASIQRLARFLSGIDTVMGKGASKRNSPAKDGGSSSSNRQSESDLELVELED